MTQKIVFSLDGREVEAGPDETIWQVAKRLGTTIPHLCWRDAPGYRADGNCRACMVEVEGERVLAASCIRRPAPGMKVNTATERAKAARHMVFELLMADQPQAEDAHDRRSAFLAWAKAMDVGLSRFPGDDSPRPDLSHPAMAVNLDACIHCNLCVRACREVQVNDVIGMAFRGPHSKIVFDFDDPMGGSTCVACGECVQACPTGALMPKTIIDAAGRGGREADRKVDSACAPIAGSAARSPTISATMPRAAATSLPSMGQAGRPTRTGCASKGGSASIMSTNPERLTRPLIRKPGLPKGLNMNPADPLTHFREASWEEALDFAAAGP